MCACVCVKERLSVSVCSYFEQVLNTRVEVLQVSSSPEGGSSLFISATSRGQHREIHLFVLFDSTGHSRISGHTYTRYKETGFHTSRSLCLT